MNGNYKLCHPSCEIHNHTIHIHTFLICGFQPYNESLELVPACRYSKETVARQLCLQKRKPLPGGIPKGEFQLISILNEGVGAALCKFDKAAAGRNVGKHQAQSTTHPQSVTDQLEPVSTSTVRY